MRIKALMLALGSSATLTQAFFRMSCPSRLVRERLDPVVNPGAVAGHVHQIAGGSGFSADMSFDDARAAECSSCQVKEDMSNYWTPELYVHHNNGSFSPVPLIGDGDDTGGGMVVYYLQRPGASNSSSGLEKLHAFPPGLRMLAGDPSLRNFTSTVAARAISFHCLADPETETNGFPNHPCPSGLRAQVFFPSCWDGENLDSKDHKSHMSYPVGGQYDSGACPASHPVHLISIFYEVLYDTGRFAEEWDGDQHPFILSNGDTTGYGFHGDFVNGWDVDTLQRAVDECNDASGVIELCPHLTFFTGEQSRACRLPPRINESVSGLLDKLPGCNEPTHGPEPSPSQRCADTATLGPFVPDFTDLTSSLHWSYAGCGIDSQSARAFPFSTSMPNMTVEYCAGLCARRGNSYAALEYADECWCGDDLREENRPLEGVLGACRMKCVGDEGQVCGGPSAMSLYRKCEGDGECVNYVFEGK